MATVPNISSDRIIARAAVVGCPPPHGRAARAAAQAFLDTGGPFHVHPKDAECPPSQDSSSRHKPAGHKPESRPGRFAEALLDHVDEILIMTVNLGWGGQAMLPEQLNKVRELREMIEAGEIHDMDLSVDGGIGPATAREARLAGANILVAGTALFGAPDPAETVRQMLG